MKSKLYSVKIPPEVADLIDSVLRRENLKPGEFLRSAISAELFRRGMDVRKKLFGIRRGLRTDMTSDEGREKALAQLKSARAQRKLEKKSSRRLTPREEMELLVRTSLPEIQKILDEIRAQSARDRRSGSSAA